MQPVVIENTKAVNDTDNIFFSFSFLTGTKFLLALHFRENLFILFRFSSSVTTLSSLGQMQQFWGAKDVAMMRYPRTKRFKKLNKIETLIGLLQRPFYQSHHPNPA